MRSPVDNGIALGRVLRGVRDSHEIVSSHASGISQRDITDCQRHVWQGFVSTVRLLSDDGHTKFSKPVFCSISIPPNSFTL